MTWSARLARIGKTELRVHITFFLMAIYAVLVFKAVTFDQSLFVLAWVLSFLILTVVHEIGHLIMAKLLRMPVRYSVIWPIGGVHVFEQEPRNPLKQILFAAAGPLLNLGVAGICELLIYKDALDINYWANNTTELSYITAVFTVAQINYFLAMFNMLPAFPLDGGRVLYGLLSWPLGRDRAGAITLAISWLVALGVLIYALYFLNFFVLLIGLMALLTAGMASPEFKERRRLLPAYLFDRGYYYFLKGQHQKAIERYTRELEAGDVKASAYFNRGLAHHVLEQYDEAIEDFDQVIKLQNDDVEAWVHRGMANFAKGDIDRAAADYEEAMVLKPGHTVAHNNRGYIYQQQGELREALNHYNQAIRFAPEFVRAYLNRASLFMERGEVARALADYNSAAEHKANDLEILLLRGRAHRQNGSRDLALDDLRAALELSSDDEQRAEIEQLIGELAYPALVETPALPAPTD